MTKTPDLQPIDSSMLTGFHHDPNTGTLTVQYKGKDFAMAFNPEFLADPLKNIDSDTVHFDFIDELSPGVIRYSKPFLYVIMPMRTA